MLRRFLLSPVVGLFLVAALLVVNTPQVRADPRDFTLVNSTGTVITHLFVGPSESSDWGDDILGRDVLDAGDSVDIVFARFDGETCLYDIKVMTQDGREGFLYKVDL